MSKRLVFPVLALVAMSLGASFNGCSCGGEAKIGNMEAKAPEPPPPPPPPTPPPPPAPEAAPPPPPPQLQTVGKARIQGNRIHIPGDVEFDVDKASIKNSQGTTEVLTTLADVMKKNPNITKLRVEGHTDNTGTPDHNMKLSNDRAASVAKWLSEHGVEAARIKTIGYGQTRPLGPNDTPEHKAQNRRTEFHVEEIDGKPAPADPNAPATAGGDTPAPAGTTAAPAATDKTAAAPPAGKAGDKAGDKPKPKDAAKPPAGASTATTPPAPKK